MKYLLDTNIVIYYLKGNSQVIEKVRKTKVRSLCISVVTLSELYYGAYKSSKTEDNINKLREVIENLFVFSCDEGIAEEFGKIKSSLISQGIPIEDFDILIAATAIKHNSVLVTNNFRHFERIPGLKLENWLTLH